MPIRENEMSDKGFKGIVKVNCCRCNKLMTVKSWLIDLYDRTSRTLLCEDCDVDFSPLSHPDL
jgi:hypothetical protein